MENNNQVLEAMSASITEAVSKLHSSLFSSLKAIEKRLDTLETKFGSLLEILDEDQPSSKSQVESEDSNPALEERYRESLYLQTARSQRMKHRSLIEESPAAVTTGHTEKAPSVELMEPRDLGAHPTFQSQEHVGKRQQTGPVDSFSSEEMPTSSKGDTSKNQPNRRSNRKTGPPRRDPQVILPDPFDRSKSHAAFSGRLSNPNTQVASKIEQELYLQDFKNQKKGGINDFDEYVNLQRNKTGRLARTRQSTVQAPREPTSSIAETSVEHRKRPLAHDTTTRGRKRRQNRIYDSEDDSNTVE